MRIQYSFFVFTIVSLLISSCSKEEVVAKPIQNIFVESITVNDRVLTDNSTYLGLDLNAPLLKIVFTGLIDVNQIDKSKFYFTGGMESAVLSFSKGSDERTLIVNTNLAPSALSSFSFNVMDGVNLGGKIVDPYKINFMSKLDETPKFPTITDDELLTLVQRKTYKYFSDYAHPTSGLARERFNSGDIVTTGGSGFGFMATVVAIERGFISRADGFALLNKSVNFLNDKAERFHGVFSHWLNGTTGKTIAFSTKDNGGDLIETAFLIQGLLTVKEYFKNGNSTEVAMCDTIDKIWREVEWSWYQRGGQNKLYWHWSPNYGWDMNMPIAGYNEGLIAYVLAASSPTFPISKTVYDEGWARNGAMKNGNSFYSTKLPLGENLGGPLFFAHYSYLGLDPRNLVDQYANYWEQNVAHTKINYSYCVANPRGQYGYSGSNWGLTASDIRDGYTASSPSNDVGVIAPTAALSSMPYTPTESIAAMRFFYYILGDKLFGDYGFKDAFNLRQGWFASSYLAIDQGPIIVMIENHRSALIWRTFMQNRDVRAGLTKLGFTY